MGDLPALTEYVLTEHAREEVIRRQISEAIVARVLGAPEQTELLRPGRGVYHSRIEWGEPPKTYLVRISVDVDRAPAEVVTVYRTSQLSKYWRADE